MKETTVRRPGWTGPLGLNPESPKMWAGWIVRTGVGTAGAAAGEQGDDGECHEGDERAMVRHASKSPSALSGAFSRPLGRRRGQ